MSYKIEKNIPKIPRGGMKAKRKDWNYPIKEMAIGDSFLTEELFNNANRTKISQRCKVLLEQWIEETTSAKLKKELEGRLYTAGRDPQRKLPNGKVDPTSGKYVRVWRTK